MDVVHALDTIKATQIINSRDKAELQHLAQSWRGAPGYADGDGHRNCYILLDSETITSAPEDRKESVWIGERFAHGSHKSSMSFQKPIFPTERIWQASLHVGGACALPMQWLHCTNESKAGSAARHQSPEFCYLPGDSMEQQSGVMVRRKGLLQTFSSFQAINEPLREHDAKRADINKDAIIYHIQAHRQYLKIEKDHAHLLQQTNEYSLRFFDSVYAGLVRRGIAVLQELPEIRPITLNSLDVVPWPSLSQTLPVKREPSAHLSSSHPLATLPAFSSDNSEFLFSAVIERASGINDLHITTFFLSHALMGMPHMKAMKINPSREKQWAELMAHAKQSKYTEDGVRITADEPFECKIRNTESGVSTVYSSRAEQIPNRLTPDSNANRRLDILRCKMLDSVTAYKSNAGRADNVVVELFRGSKLLIKFLIPWSARRVGHMVQSKGQTRLDPWTGSSVKDVPDRADLHMCVPGMESPPDKEMLPLYTEFVQHHASLGVQHFHIGTMFSWDSQPMHDLVQVLRPYILSGLVTITTQTDDYNMLYSTGGLTWSRDDSKIFFVNMCLYYAKGMADYVGIWDFDEFFIPRPPFNSIMDIVHSMEAKSSVDMEVAVSTLRGMSVDMAKKQYSSGPGLADGDAHPLCYILLLSECVHNHPEENMFNPSSPWIGQRYDHLPEQKSSHAFKKSILPTSKIFYAGLHMSGACKLPHPWNSCEKNDARDFCYSNRPRDYYGLSYTELDNKQVDFSFFQVFNGVVMDKDAKQMQVKSQGVIYHFQFHRQSMLASLFASRSTEKNEYALRFFPSVMEELQKRGITFIQNFPALVRRADNPLFGPLWTRAQKFFSEERV